MDIKDFQEEEIREQVLPGYGDILQRPDGSYVINGNTYHVTVEDSKYQHVHAYTLENPEKVTQELPPSPPTLEETKAAKLAEIADARWRAEVGGIEYAGLRAYTDRDSQAKYTGAIVTYQVAQQLPEAWKCENGWLPIATIDDLMGLAMAVQVHIQACYQREAESQYRIYTATTIQEVEAITWAWS